jgi:ornithine carbamoyltransferase
MRRSYQESGLEAKEGSREVCSSPASVDWNKLENRVHTIRTLMVDTFGT